MFDHPEIKKYAVDEIPLDTDIFLVDVKWMEQYEEFLLKIIHGGDDEPVGYVSPVAARSINSHDIDLTWYANVYDRWHEISVTLPKDQIVMCVECWNYSEKPHLFVKSEWINHLHLKQYSIFCLIDAIDVKQAISERRLSRSNLIYIQRAIDELAAINPSVSFISFADSILLKSNWTVGMFDSSIKYTYNPGYFINLACDIDKIFLDCANLHTYAIIAQGSNEFDIDSLLHISPSNNHVSLNSLGGPFAKLLEIDYEIRIAIKNGAHSKSDFYLDAQYYHSLSFRQGIEKNDRISYQYKSKFSPSPSNYFCLLRNEIQTVLAT